MPVSAISCGRHCFLVAPMLSFHPVGKGEVVSGQRMSADQSMSVDCRATAYPAGADSQAAYPATGILRITPVDGLAARLAFITVKVNAAVETDKHKIIPVLGSDMD